MPASIDTGLVRAESTRPSGAGVVPDVDALSTAGAVFAGVGVHNKGGAGGCEGREGSQSGNSGGERDVHLEVRVGNEDTVQVRNWEFCMLEEVLIAGVDVW